MSREHDERGGLDEALSAWVDGELSPESEAELRAALEAGVELRERVQQFRGVDEALRAVATPGVPAGLAARVRQAIDAQAAEEADGANVLPLATPSERRTPLGRSAARRFAPAAAALAAGLAVAFVLSTRDGGAPSDLADLPAPTPRLAASPDPVAGSDWSDLPDDEVAVALELESLADFEVIEQLEVLELLVAFDDAGEGLGS